MAQDMIEVTFKKDKETKGSIRFAEVVEGDDDPYLRTIYVPKKTLKELGNENGSKPLTVVISA